MRLPIITATALVAASVATAQASSIALVDPALVDVAPDSTVADFRYRLSNTNWDIGVAPAGDPIGGFQQVNAGNNGALSGNTYAFSLSHAAGTGYTFEFFDVNGADRTVSFTTADGVRNDVAATDAFNTISIGPSARTTNQSGAASSVQLSNLNFSSTDLGADIDIPDFGSSAVQGGAQDGLVEQFLVSDHNLALVDWALTGNATLSRSVFNNTDERVKLDIKTRSATVVPLPAAAPLLLGGLAALGLLRRRRPAA